MTGLVSDQQTKTNPHIFFSAGEAPGAPGLRSAKCSACGRYTLGRVTACQHCFARDVNVVAAGQEAEIIEYSIARHPAGGFDAPYAIGQIRTSEGLVLFAPLIGETNGLAPGERLRFVVVDHRAGAQGFAYARMSASGDPA